MSCNNSCQVEPAQRAPCGKTDNDSCVCLASCSCRSQPIAGSSDQPVVNVKLQQQAVRIMARQQLTVSDDSPFNILTALDNDSEREHARVLREETEEIKRQLDLVKGRLSEFNLAKDASSSNDRQHLATDTDRSNHGGKCNDRVYEYDQQVTSSDSQFNRENQSITSSRLANQAHGESSCQINVELTRLRPLTGKTDCPNCACDRRRQSICDNCLSLQQSSQQSSAPSERLRRPSFIVADQQPDKLDEKSSGEQSPTKSTPPMTSIDERPIRPSINGAREREAQPPEKPLQSVDRALVPNQLFTIGKSLNDKRAQLAKAIEDLQLMMDKVKKRGERLDQERKVAQLYKEQWRFGPNIGVTSQQGVNQVRGHASYQSRLDPQLARDSNALMGFQHVEPAMKSNRKNASNNLTETRGPPPRTPQPKPRLSRLANKGAKLPSVAHQNALSNRLSNSKTWASSGPSGQPTRSKSLDSLNQIDKLTVTTRRADVSIRPRVIRHKKDDDDNFHEGKSSSDVNLAGDKREAEETIEEELEEVLEAAIESTAPAQDVDVATDEQDIAAKTRLSETGANVEDKGRPTGKTSWVPVFGETEIKTIDRRQPSRKTLILGAQTNGGPGDQRPPVSILRYQPGSNQLSRTSALKQRSHSALTARPKNGYSPIMNEATKKIQFANNLLEREQHDSRTRNQLIVSNRFRPPPVVGSRYQSETQRSFRPASNRDSNATASKRRQQPTNKSTQEFISGAHQEINRLEAMISDQQSVLAKLIKKSSACCCGQHHGLQSASSNQQTKIKRIASPPLLEFQNGHATSHNQASGQLIVQLRERLNRTKTRLAKTLETERAKHQQLERRMHSSLRRQSDLRAENELLRQSLDKCIDTCLRDIASTFESLSDTLVDSVASLGLGQTTQSNGPGELTDVAQLIADNRHLKQMRGHIETIENQRRSIFEELSNEKIRSKQLEMQLIQSKIEQDQLMDAKRKLERNLIARDIDPHSSTSDENRRPGQREPQPSTSKQHVELAGGANTSSMSGTLDVGQPSVADVSEKTISGSDEQFEATTSSTLDSIDVYRKYIQSMTPDLDAIRRERRMILDEFDNIKKMLANMND